MKSFIVFKDGKYSRVKASRPTGDWGAFVVGEAEVSDEDAQFITGYNAETKTVTINTVQRDAVLEEQDLNKQAQALYKQMVDDVLAEMKSVFGSTSTDGAIATYQTWQDMLASPASYILSGLEVDEIVLDENENPIFGIGDLLNTPAKVTQYAQAKTNQARAYGIWRFKRLNKFRKDKQNLGG